MTYTAEDVIQAFRVGYDRGIEQQEPLDDEQVLKMVELEKQAREANHG